MSAKTANTNLCNIALIGTKFMGRAHSNAYLKVNKFFDLPCKPVMHTVAARNQEELKIFADRWGWQHCATDWKSAVHSEAIDLVDVVTTNNVHAEHTIAALEAGKHVACEKPLAGTLSDARQMVEAAEKATGKTFVWYNYRRCPAIAFAHQLCAAGKLGRIYQIRGCYLQDWAGPDTPLMCDSRAMWPDPEHWVICALIPSILLDSSRVMKSAR